ncbi:hypothetical protein, partial [Mycobacterium sp. E2462]|uniref:hypothetical protein n=1 Tax=Mycobacterium sp. E2462 TaxID=1834133 RepID=UPI000B212A07
SLIGYVRATFLVALTDAAGQTRAIPVPSSDADDAAEPTTALPAARPEDEADPATEKLTAHGDNGDAARQRRRTGGGLSAQDLLRREGRL